MYSLVGCNLLSQLSIHSEELGLLVTGHNGLFPVQQFHQHRVDLLVVVLPSGVLNNGLIEELDLLKEEGFLFLVGCSDVLIQHLEHTSC